jgi:hypothetical protein
LNLDGSSVIDPSPPNVSQFNDDKTPVPAYHAHSFPFDSGIYFYGSPIEFLRRVMNVRSISYALMLLGIAIILLAGCSNSGVDSQVAPSDGERPVASVSTGHECWGLWQFVADPAKQTLDVMRLREGNMHLNALVFLEPPPFVNLTLESLQFNGNVIEADIGLKHPFLGLDEFTGFDVCGILITNGTETGYTDTVIRLAGQGDTRLLNPDGFTRWWNPSEFPHTNTMFGYKDGLLGTPDDIGNFNCTVNAYKYFADDLTSPDAPLGDINLAHRGLFSAGHKNVRH